MKNVAQQLVMPWLVLGGAVSVPVLLVSSLTAAESGFCRRCRTWRAGM